jgi:DNA-directed RNA polymerase subunit RPC12/RpoP
MNLVHIASGWYHYIKASQSTKQLMDSRLAICETCPHKVQMNHLGVVLVQSIHEEGNIYRCGICSCPLSTLTAAPAASCKDGRWKALGIK